MMDCLTEAELCDAEAEPEAKAEAEAEADKAEVEAEADAEAEAEGAGASESAWKKWTKRWGAAGRRSPIYYYPCFCMVTAAREKTTKPDIGE